MTFTDPENVNYLPIDITPQDNEMGVVVPKKRGKGRPKKSELDAVRRRTKGKRGRPVGDAGRMREFKERLLATAGDRIITKVIQIGLDDAHPGQMAALKMCMDRMLPTSMFEKDAKGGRNAVTINIVGVNETKIISHEDNSDNEELNLLEDNYGEIVEVEEVNKGD